MEKQRIDVPGGDVVLYPAPPLGINPTVLFEELYFEIPWVQKSVVIYGVERPQPRLISWHGDYAYTYSGLRLEPKPWTERLKHLRNVMSKLCSCPFNGVLLNLYADGRSSIGMHSDDEIEFGEKPTIASLSLGAERRFDFKAKDGKGPLVKTTLTNGSVLVMAGNTQRFWKHGIAKTTIPVGPRINLTFRDIVVCR